MTIQIIQTHDKPNELSVDLSDIEVTQQEWLTTLMKIATKATNQRQPVKLTILTNTNTVMPQVCSQTTSYLTNKQIFQDIYVLEV